MLVANDPSVTGIGSSDYHIGQLANNAVSSYASTSVYYCSDDPTCVEGHRANDDQVRHQDTGDLPTGAPFHDDKKQQVRDWKVKKCEGYDEMFLSKYDAPVKMLACVTVMYCGLTQSPLPLIGGVSSR